MTIFDAIRNNDIVSVKSFMDRGWKKDTYDREVGATVLEYAIAQRKYMLSKFIAKYQGEYLNVN